MSRKTSLGEANVRQLCRAFGVSPQAFYAARTSVSRPTPIRKSNRSPGASVADLEPKIRLLAQDHPAWACARCGPVYAEMVSRSRTRESGL
jgi:transposase-like protein